MMHMDFFIQHRLGHHKYAATPLDPASAVKGEDVYSFAVKSVFYSLKQGYQREAKRLTREHPHMSVPRKIINNQMFQLKFLDYFLLGGVVWVWGC